ncbi:MAG: PAS domain S-box protein [Desulfobacterales bacterium]|nr:MAG: PAS domain S-box protein [Desulfobacterales bacterium]
MKDTIRPKIEKPVVMFIIFIAVFFLLAGAVLGLSAIKEMKKIVADQFNQEQLVIARMVKQRIEREIKLLKREFALLAEDISARPLDLEDQNERIQQSFFRVLESGVWKIESVDISNRRLHTFMPHRRWSVKPILEGSPYPTQLPTIPENESVWVSPPQIKTWGFAFYLAAPLPDEKFKYLIFHINASWFLAPFLKEIRSGSSGYVWMIEQNGYFLFHPDANFIGKNAFTAREEKFPDVPFAKINFIQRERMLKGQQGTGWYYSGWHRGITGQIKKLIAYCPVVVSEEPPQSWSVAVVAPVSEIEGALRKGSLKLFLLQGLVIVFILFGSATILVFEIRWSRLLEKKVQQRTEELKKSEEKYRSLVESAEDFIFTVDSQGQFQSMNSFTANFFGGHPQDFIGKHLSSLFSEPLARRQHQLTDLVYHHGKSVREEFKIQFEEHPIWISVNFMPIKNDRGEVSSVLCIARDITENKNLERQLVNAEKLASLGTLAAGVAHEVNNPLGVILGFTDILLRKTETGSQDYEDLKAIERQGLHCKEVIENLLSFTRVEEDSHQYADVNTSLEETIKIVRHVLEMNHINLVMQLTPGLPMVEGDSRQLQQVFLNLITNAVAAMKEGGALIIRTYFKKKHRKTIVQFRDTGIGIKPEDIDHIFEPFFTTKPEGEGTGLGLFVSYGIIAKYGGTIDCFSQCGDNPGKPSGTTFTVKLVTV